MIATLILLAAFSTSAGAEDLSKATSGYLLTSDCEEGEICHSYAIEVSKKFVRLPIKKQLSAVGKFCARLDKIAEDYQDEAGNDWTIDTCVFKYHGQDAIYRATDGRVYAEGWYVAALAALRD